LIELLVVIAIIAILAAILFPIFTTVKEKARQTACLNNMMQLSKGFRMYLDNTNGQYPSASPLNVGGLNYNAYMAVVNSGWVYFPGSGTVDVTRGGIYPYVKNARVYVCPSDMHEVKTHFGLSYSMNSTFQYLKESAIRRPAGTVFLVDEGKGSYSKARRGIISINDGCFGVNPLNLDQGDMPAEAHCGGGNFGYADGHVKWVSLKNFRFLNFNYQL